jgi:hypothetical protein
MKLRAVYISVWHLESFPRCGDCDEVFRVRRRALTAEHFLNGFHVEISFEQRYAMSQFQQCQAQITLTPDGAGNRS